MARKTYHYDEKLGRMVEGPGRPRAAGSGDSWRFSDRIYSDAPFKAPDGTVIDSRKKHREYMRRAGVTTMDDFKGTWEQARQRREAVFTGQHDRAERREAVARAFEQHQRRG
jgi:hypothetical protein